MDFASRATRGGSSAKGLAPPLNTFPKINKRATRDERTDEWSLKRSEGGVRSMASGHDPDNTKKVSKHTGVRLSVSKSKGGNLHIQGREL